MERIIAKWTSRGGKYSAMLYYNDAFKPASAVALHNEEA